MKIYNVILEGNLERRYKESGLEEEEKYSGAEEEADKKRKVGVVSGKFCLRFS